MARAFEADIAVFLVPARTDTKWFHDLVLPKAKEIRFIRGRLRFGDGKNPAPFPSMVVIFEKSSAQSLGVRAVRAFTSTDCTMLFPWLRDLP